jgi:hypothetical protein
MATVVCLASVCVTDEASASVWDHLPLGASNAQRSALFTKLRGQLNADPRLADMPAAQRHYSTRSIYHDDVRTPTHWVNLGPNGFVNWVAVPDATPKD